MSNPFQKEKCASHTEVEKVQLSFLKNIFEKKQKSAFFAAAESLVRFYGALSRVEYDGTPQIIKLNYHPDDVELWLADFGASAFLLYKNFQPPHLKYLLLDKSPLYCFSFIDTMWTEMNRRQNLFKIILKFRNVDVFFTLSGVLYL